MDLYSEISNCMYTWDDALKIDATISTQSSNEKLLSKGLYRLLPKQPPSVGKYQFIKEARPTKTINGYERNYEVVEMFPTDIIDLETKNVLTIQDQKDAYDFFQSKKLEAEKNAQTVTPRQARQALIELDLDDQVEAVINSIPDEKQKKTVRNWYEYSTLWIYGNPVLAQFASALQIDKDEFFELAKTL